ncbi:MAG: cyclomaltodextrinase C-terminal domain-containing protein, partial [Prevotella sp.]|nr:cyclomaltodextrinase C-terminal domain-containing protein [Prevotella sp.]
WHRHVVMTVINGTSKPAKVDIKRYAELIEEQTEAEDITTGKTVSLKKDIPLSPRQTMILEF